MEDKTTASAFSAYGIAKYGATAQSSSCELCDRILICETFYLNESNNLAGSFFSCIYQGALRIHVVFYGDLDQFNDEIAALIDRSMDESYMDRGKVWFHRTNQRIIAHLGVFFLLTPDSEQFFYDSTEYIMRRDRFRRTFDDTVLHVRSYEEVHIDEYLSLLNDAMAFKIPPHDYTGEKARYIELFRDLEDHGAFEAFWKDGHLVGLYWLEGTEIDHMAVSSRYQRTGYGTLILTRAIERVLRNHPDAEYAVLYCVGWNRKAQHFYQQYGMEFHGQYRVPYDE